MKIPASLTATKLRIVLLASLVLILLAGGGIFYFAYGKLSQTATEVGDQVAKSQESQDTIQQLQALQKDLEDDKDIVQMAANVTADSQNYAYQDRLINDLTVYAARAGLSLTNISFAANQASSGSAPAQPSNPEGGAGEATPAPAATGLRKATVDITLSNPTDYRSLLNFLHYIEQNLTKLKVSKVSLAKSTEGGVSVDVLNLEVNVR